MKVSLDDEEALVKLAKKTTIDLEQKEEGLRIYLDAQDVSLKIRSQEVTNNTFYIARAPRVREILVNWQREIGSKKSIVAEGRDVGTVVFPKATKKFYLDASVTERWQRRLRELQLQKKEVDPQKLLIEIKERDQKDLTRAVGPLKKADDAIFIDSTNLTIQQVTEKILEHIN